MLFLFRGPNRHIVRAIVGAIFLVIGIVVPAPLLAGIGVVFLIWGGIGALSSQRVRRQGHVGYGGRMS